MSCKSYRHNRQRLIRETWLKHISPDITCFFFEGGTYTVYIPNQNRLIVNCPDTYQHTALKSKLAIQYTVENLNPDYIFKCDDDTYINHHLLNKFIPKPVDYTGRKHVVRGIRYCDGGGFILSKHSAEVITNYKYSDGEGRGWWYGAGAHDSGWDISENIKKDTTIEDMMIGDILNQSNIEPTNNKTVLFSTRESAGFNGDLSNIKFDCLAYHPVYPDDMLTVYENQNKEQINNILHNNNS
jgi:hypothetical protein